MSKTKDKIIREQKKPAIIVDIDGTLAFMKDRTPFQYHKAINDGVFSHIADIVDKYHNDFFSVLVVSGRDEECKTVTMEWLDKHQIPYDVLFMRSNGDKRGDDIVKKELYNKYIKDNFDIFFVLDDRDKVVKMWRNLGLPCLQVAPGDF